MASSSEQDFDVVCFIKDPDTQSTVSKAIARLDGHTSKMSKGGLKEATAYVKASKNPKVICVDCSDQDLLISYVEEFIGFCSLETQVIIIGQKNDVGIFRDLLKLDVADYMVKPVFPDILLNSLSLALSSRQRRGQEAPKRAGKVIYFLGTAGGVGTTTLVVNTACALAKDLGRRVLLIDADLQFGTVAAMLNLKPSLALQEAIEDPDRVDDVFLENSMASFGERLRILSTEESLLDPVDLDVEALLKSFDRLLDIVSRKFHYILVDFSRHHSFLWQPLAQRANMIFLVSDLTVSSLRDTLRIFGSLSERTGSRSSVIINNVKQRYALPLGKFEELLGGKIEAVISFENTALEAADLGIPLIEHKKSFRKEIEKIITLMSGRPTLREKASSLWNRLLATFKGKPPVKIEDEAES